jgi:chemotaxis protein methyltransferase CheR
MNVVQPELIAHEVSPITDTEFDQYRRFIFQHAGIDLSPQKRHLVSARLHKRLVHHQHRSFSEYFQLISAPGGESERQMLIDLLTTNETYFFREPQHFDFLRQHLLPRFRGKPMHVWSAACSSGEEVYTLAMVLAEELGQGEWEIRGSDISQRMLAAARQAVYPMERANGIPAALLTKYCLKGVRSQQGYFQIDARLRQHTGFESINLLNFRVPRPLYDLIFLRNVLIYFNLDTKRDIVSRVLSALRPGGYLIVSHVESLHGVSHGLEMVEPSIFRRPGRAGA